MFFHGIFEGLGSPALLVSTRDEDRRPAFDSETAIQDREERGNTDLMPNLFALWSCSPH